MRQMLINLRDKKPRILVAKELGITPQMLGAIERGTRNPSRKLTKKIAEYYNVTIHEVNFFIEDGDITSHPI